MIFLKNIIKLYIIINFFSNDFFVSVDNLLFLVVTFLIFSAYYLFDYSKSNFLLKKKNEIYKEYFIKLYNLFFFLDLYKNFLKKKINNINFLINLLKFILNFLKNYLFNKLNSIKNIIIFLYNNYLNSYYIENIVLKKILNNHMFNLKFKKYYFLKFYNTVLNKIN